MCKQKVLVIVGPTASGKTSLSIELAKKFDGEIVSADSMQIYKNMEIATAKPTEEEKQGIKHHLMDFLPLDEEYSVGQYVADAQKVIEDISKRGKLPIICGGTGLYIDSLIKGFNFSENSVDEELRLELQNTLKEKGVDYLLEILRDFDPTSAEKLAIEKNGKRIIRAIEFYKTTGKTITMQNDENSNEEYIYDCFIIGLTAIDRQVLYDRINMRVDIMLEQGLLEETESVLNLPLSNTSSKAIGYKELSPFFNGDKSIDECIDNLKVKTRNYAKRQLTWFRRNKNVNWINIDNFSSKEDIINYAVNLIYDKGFLNG